MQAKRNCVSNVGKDFSLPVVGDYSPLGGFEDLVFLLKFAKLLFQFINRHKVALTTTLLLLLISDLILELANLSLKLLLDSPIIFLFFLQEILLLLHFCNCIFIPRFFDCEILLVLGIFG